MTQDFGSYAVNEQESGRSKKKKKKKKKLNVHMSNDSRFWFVCSKFLSLQSLPSLYVPSARSPAPSTIQVFNYYY